jgi:hypothetical protein
MRQFAKLLSVEEPAWAARQPPAWMVYPSGPGALLMRTTWNRNIDWTAAAKTLAVTTGRWWSAATYGGLGRGRLALTPELLADFSAVLDIAAEDLAVLTGPIPPADLPTQRSSATGVAELIWDVRRLNASQLEQIRDLVSSMRQ